MTETLNYSLRRIGKLFQKSVKFYLDFYVVQPCNVRYLDTFEIPGSGDYRGSRGSGDHKRFVFYYVEKDPRDTVREKGGERG